MKPSDFKNASAMGSVLRNCEAEIVACNIMVILRRTKDEFRPLSWEEYKEERLKDGAFTEGEKHYFDKVLPYFESAKTAALFCPGWADVYKA